MLFPGFDVWESYPFRVLPQVDGVTVDACTALEQVLDRELNARTENALIEGDEALPKRSWVSRTVWRTVAR